MTFADYAAYDAIGLADLVRRREVSASELLDAAIDRVAAVDPHINAIVQDLELLARTQIDYGLSDGPFAGVPFLLKDHGLDLKGAPTRDGSRFHSNRSATRNSTLTEHYLKAGLVIFGKTNTPEFAISGSTEPKAFGECRNPWDLSRGVGGSSGGSAAAVSAGYVPMAHGTDGGGSIRNPSSACGVFGLKPSRGRVVGGPDIFHSVGDMSVHHAIARSVRDSAALLDATSATQTGKFCAGERSDITFLEAADRPLKSLKIAFHLEAHRNTAIDPACHEAVLSAAKLCEELGHTVEEARPNIDGDEALTITSLFWRVSAAQCVYETAQSLSRNPSPGELEWITEMLAREGAGISAIAYASAINAMHRFERSLNDFFTGYDAVLSPVVSQPPWPLDTYENGCSDTRSYFETVSSYSPFCWPYNLSGQPGMSVPLYWTKNNLPVGAHFAGRIGDEATLLRLARQLEEARPWQDRRPKLEFLDCASADREVAGRTISAT